MSDADGFASTLVKQALEKRRFEETSEEQGKSRWTRFSEQIRKNPPLSGAGDHVRECSREFRDEFAFGHDSEQDDMGYLLDLDAVNILYDDQRGKHREAMHRKVSQFWRLLSDGRKNTESLRM